MFRNKRLIIALLLAALIAGIFWSQSRIPALSEKAQMGLRTNFGAIAFEVILPVTDDQLLLERIFRSAVNWGYTNLQGMLFGLLFAAAILTLLANLRSREFKRPWLNALSGIFVGAPLGVCVNCATPIAFGIYSAGARLETALASLIASPTLNIIVLTMTFTLLPWEIAMAKLAGVALVLISIPFLIRRFFDSQNSRMSGTDFGAAKLPLPPPVEAANLGVVESFAAAVGPTLRQFFLNLFYLTRFALPLMLLAGILGATVVELLPFERLDGLKFGPLTVLVAAIVATLLPVPIALDVIVAMALLASGASVGLVCTILFALGIFSVYPMAMIMRYISGRLSLAIFGLVVIVAMALGWSIQSYFDSEIDAEQQVINSGLSNLGVELYQQAVGVCDDIPESLQTECFIRHIDDFENIVAIDGLCEHRPENLSPAYCNYVVQRYSQTQKALAAASTEPCFELPDANATQNCRFSVLLQLAQADHDIGRCDELSDERIVRECRSAYLNASLLFHPDDSACAELPDIEREDCKVNAAIYRLSDTLNFEGCDTLLPAEARDHCRYTIASTAIGRHDDASGCQRIESPALADRCSSLSQAWQAARQLSFESCGLLDAIGLRDTCYLRVADGRIRQLIAQSIPGLSAEISVRAPEKVAAASAPGNTPEINWTATEFGSPDDSGLTVTTAEYRDRENPTTGIFRRVDATALGISRYWKFGRTDMFEPFIIGKGIASGDFNNDGWPDIVLASERGIWLYRNIGGRFELASAGQGDLGGANVFLVAFFDADNDGWQDIFASSYGGQNYLLMNSGGSFERSEVTRVGGSKRLALSAGFADIDQDGLLDIVLGNWSSGVEKLFSAADSANSLLLRRGDSYRIRSLGGLRGETNSVLLADVNDDDATDVLIGNDRLVPDQYYLDGVLDTAVPLSVGDRRVPATSMFTMSLESADFNNDLKMDLFSTDMTFARSSRDDYCAPIEGQAEHSHCVEMLRAYQSLRSEGASSCESLANTVDRSDCLVGFAIAAAKTLQDDRYCDQLPDKRSAAFSLCEYLAAPTPASESINQRQHLEQLQRNTLLLSNDGRFEERAQEYGVASSFWSWNAKAADLDSDGWQDIYVGNGFHFGENFYEIQENIMFRNLEGQGFVEVQKQWGLDDPINTPSYTYADIDRDGDIDIVATGVLAPPRVYLNELRTGNSIGIELRDDVGNSSAIGAKVTVQYGGPQHLRQTKAIKLSGGFLSFDNPVLSFGIADHGEIDKLTVRWPDGQESVIAGALPANRFYRLHRTHSSQAAMRQ